MTPVEAPTKMSPREEPTEITPSKTPTRPEDCDPHLTFDAITTLRGEILFFKGRYVLSFLATPFCDTHKCKA